MMRIKELCVFFVLLSLFGCVTTKEYNARLADVAGLKNDVSSLEGKLKQKEDEKAALSADLAKLSEEHSKLQKDYDELKKQNQTLAQDNANLDNLLKAKKDELRVTITELRGKLSEKESEMSAKNAEIEALKKQLTVLTQEKDALNQEKDAALKEKERSVAEMKKTYDSLMGEMNQEIKKGEITITQLKDKLSVNLVEKILFDSGSAEIKKDGKKVLDRVAEILAKVTDKQVRVAGYTDNVPISPRLAAKFPSNWELSTARATTVARYLQDKGINPNVLSASGYSEYRPVAPNDTEEGRAKNRRIDIDLAPKELDKAAAEGMPK
jgi:chemotaxis protein MotB